MHKENCFITLTYNKKHLPSDGSLDLDHWQKFLKRFRKYLAKQDIEIRTYHAGEYGTKHFRPHYHALIFGYDLPDQVLHQVNNGINLYTSKILSDIWGKGFVSVGKVTMESAGYVARYILKKQHGDAAQEHYERVDPYTGEVINLKPEYTTMSNRPGIAREWFVKYGGDVYPDDFITMKGKKFKPPKYYDGLYEHQDPKGLKKIKIRITAAAEKKAKDNTADRLAIREAIHKLKASKLPRNLDSDNDTKDILDTRLSR